MPKQKTYEEIMGEFLPSWYGGYEPLQPSPLIPQSMEEAKQAGQYALESAGKIGAKTFERTARLPHALTYGLTDYPPPEEFTPELTPEEEAATTLMDFLTPDPGDIGKVALKGLTITPGMMTKKAFEKSLGRKVPMAEYAAFSRKIKETQAPLRKKWAEVQQRTREKFRPAAETRQTYGKRARRGVVVEKAPEEEVARRGRIELGEHHKLFGVTERPEHLEFQPEDIKKLRERGYWTEGTPGGRVTLTRKHSGLLTPEHEAAHVASSYDDIGEMQKALAKKEVPIHPAVKKRSLTQWWGHARLADENLATWQADILAGNPIPEDVELWFWRRGLK